MVFVSTTLLANAVDDAVKSGYFGIDSTHSTVQPKSPCVVNLLAQSYKPTEEEAKTDNYISTLLMEHYLHQMCILQSVSYDISYTSSEQEQKFCGDDVGFNADVLDTVAKMKVAKNPTSGLYAGKTFTKYIPLMTALQAQRPAACR